jgi:hypothetical protein
MRKLPWVTTPLLTLWLSGCVTATPTPVEPPPVSGKVICEETQAQRTKVASDIGKISDGLMQADPAVGALVVSAGTLVIQVDAGCAK